jgi:hypothetical protein
MNEFHFRYIVGEGDSGPIDMLPSDLNGEPMDDLMGFIRRRLDTGEGRGVLSPPRLIPMTFQCRCFGMSAVAVWGTCDSSATQAPIDV